MVSKDDNVKVYTLSDVPQESNSIEFNIVRLTKKWALWEGYETPPKEGGKESKDDEWKSTIRKVFEFEDIVSFWQLWNNSIFSNFSQIFNNGERIR
jgi:hypothetical protein